MRPTPYSLSLYTIFSFSLFRSFIIYHFFSSPLSHLPISLSPFPPPTLLFSVSPLSCFPLIFFHKKRSLSLSSLFLVEFQQHIRSAIISHQKSSRKLCAPSTIKEAYAFWFQILLVRNTLNLVVLTLLKFPFVLSSLRMGLNGVDFWVLCPK